MQKHHRLLVQGFARNPMWEVVTVSGLPVNRLNSNRTFIKAEDEIVDDVHYTYLPVVNVPIVKNIVHAVSGFYKTIKYCRKGENSRWR